MMEELPWREIVRRRIKLDRRTQLEIAAAAEIHHTNVSHYICGDTSLGLLAFERLCKQVGLELRDVD